MSEKVARSHTSLSNRARARDNVERKVVYRSVVDNPFRVQWPVTPFNVQNAILACLVDMLAGVADYNIARSQLSRKRRRRSSGNPKSRKRPRGNSDPDVQKRSADAVDDADQGREGCADSIADVATVPPILRALTVGINEVTKRLESLANRHRSTMTTGPVENAISSDVDGAAPSPTYVVIACRADVDPPVLMAHLPNLVAACNISRSPQSTPGGRAFLVSLPKGAESTLAEATGLRRASVILIEDSAPQFGSLEPLVQNLPVLSAPWLQPPSSEHHLALVPTHIKQLRTTAPKDMKHAKEKRSQERASARAGCSSKIDTVPKRITVAAP
ncbi:hypothetical protein BD413DRAFT_509241 [Trametes elegans]|nr:hypothetical protein BD413DRAFT_509241 [Trametes elegans]